MRDPTKKEMVDGIAQGIQDYLKFEQNTTRLRDKPSLILERGISDGVSNFLSDMSAGKYGNNRPLKVFDRVIGNAVTNWMRDNTIEDCLPQRAPDTALEIVMNCRKKSDGTFARHYKRKGDNSTLCGVSLKTGTWDVSRAQFITCTKCDRIVEKQARKTAPDVALLAAARAILDWWTRDVGDNYDPAEPGKLMKNLNIAIAQTEVQGAEGDCAGTAQ